MEKTGGTLQVPFVTTIFLRNKVVDDDEGLKASEDLLANFLIDFENQQSITSTLNLKVDLKETKYHETLNMFHNHDTKIQQVSKAIVIAQQQQACMQTHQSVSLKGQSLHLHPSFLNCPILHLAKNVVEQNNLLINKCPCCFMWYNCLNIVVVSCGHTYHPWCLATYPFNAN